MIRYSTMTRPEDDPALAFAAEELQRYWRAVTGNELIAAAQGDAVLTVDSSLDADYDAYAVDAQETTLHIRGAHPRAVLYGVYAFCEQVLGVRFLHPGFEYVPTHDPAQLEPATFSRKANMRLRAYHIDAAHSLTYGVDAMAKLGYNTYFVGAGYWAQHDREIRDALTKRGMKLALSGHDIAFYVPPSTYFADHPDWFALHDGQRTPEQLCFSNEEFIAELAKRVGDYCEKLPNLEVMVLMFNDNAFKCQCEHCRASGFMPSYLHMVQAVQEHLTKRGLDIKLCHIAYNAALAWDMLEGVPEGDIANGVIACWGRNYTYAVEDAQGEQDVRFKQNFDAWGKALKAHGREYIIYEYYADYWMMGTLLPPLGSVIAKDVPYFRSIGASGVDVLEFSIPGELSTLRLITQELYSEPLPVHNEYDTLYQIAWHNHYVLGKSMWEGASSYEDLLKVYAPAAFGAAAESCATLLCTAETALAPLSRFSSSMFKLRITDAWLRDDFSAKATRRTQLHRWSPENACREVTKEAAEACEQAYREFAAKEPELQHAETLLPGLPDGQRENLADFIRTMHYFLDKTQSLAHQYRAQLAIEDNASELAIEHLRQALVLERHVDGTGIEDCENWLKLLEQR